MATAPPKKLKKLYSSRRPSLRRLFFKATAIDLFHFESYKRGVSIR
jgi:hypothetical protein